MNIEEIKGYITSAIEPVIKRIQVLQTDRNEIKQALKHYNQPKGNVKSVSALANPNSQKNAPPAAKDRLIEKKTQNKKQPIQKTSQQKKNGKQQERDHSKNNKQAVTGQQQSDSVSADQKQKMNSNVHQTNASQVIKKNTPLSQVVTDPKKNIQNDKKTPVVQNRTLSALDKKNIKDNRNNEEPNKSQNKQKIEESKQGTNNDPKKQQSSKSNDKKTVNKSEKSKGDPKAVVDKQKSLSIKQNPKDKAPASKNQISSTKNTHYSNKNQQKKQVKSKDLTQKKVAANEIKTQNQVKNQQFQNSQKLQTQVQNKQVAQVINKQQIKEGQTRNQAENHKIQ